MDTGQPRRGRERTSLRRRIFTLFYYLSFLPLSTIVRRVTDVLDSSTSPDQASYFRLSPHSPDFRSS
jgi:hypothetical protein